MSTEKTLIYVTRYALTEGPFCIHAEILNGGTMAYYNRPGGNSCYVHGNDFWLTEKEAIADCDRRREAKIKSIEKQKAKLEKMKFSIEDKTA